MRPVVVGALFLVGMTISLNQARKFRNFKEKARENYAPASSLIESSMESYGENYVEAGEDGYYPQKKPSLPLTYFISQFLFGSFFLVSALLCAVQATCESTPTVYITQSTTTTTTTLTTTTSPTTTPLTATSTTRTTTPITRTSTKSVTFTATTTRFPTATSVTRTTSTTFTSTTSSRTVVIRSTSISTTTTTRFGRRRRSIALNDNFWIDAKIDPELTSSDAPIDPSIVASVGQLFTALNVDWDPERVVDSSLLQADNDA